MFNFKNRANYTGEDSFRGILKKTDILESGIARGDFRASWERCLVGVGPR